MPVDTQLTQKAAEIRRLLLRSIHAAGVGHVGGSLSIAELIAVLYFNEMNIDPANPSWHERDRFVMSKGHCGPALYAALAMRGFFPVDELDTLNQQGSRLPSHCDMNRTPGVDMTAGSLGQGFSCALGMAVAAKLDKLDSNIFALVGDGECQEGQIWEAALFAAHRNLDNVILFVDDNGMQIDGTTDQVCKMGDIAAKFAAFGWHSQTIDGHSTAAIKEAISVAKAAVGKPSVIVMKTKKGRGVPEFEDKVSSHSNTVTATMLIAFDLSVGGQA